MPLYTATSDLLPLAICAVIAVLATGWMIYKSRSGKRDSNVVDGPVGWKTLCANNPDSFWCTDAIQVYAPPSDKVLRKLLTKIHRKARKFFRYRADLVQFDVKEVWHSHVEAAEAGKVWRDDCDGFAATVSDMAYGRGVPVTCIHLLVCKTETDTGHLVCGIKDNDGNMHILDNRKGKVIEMSQAGYTWIMSMSGSEPGVWRSIGEGEQ